MLILSLRFLSVFSDDVVVNVYITTFMVAALLSYNVKPSELSKRIKLSIFIAT